MLVSVRAEALARIGAARSMLRLIEAYELDRGAGDVASRSAKGMLFVQNYAVYEYVILQTVRALVADVNSKGLAFTAARSELLSMALHPEFSSLIDGSPKKTWGIRGALVRRARAAEPIRIVDGLFPKDGSHFRTQQLETIWCIFGVQGPVVPQPRLRSHIEELVDTRNRVAHGTDAAADVGGRFSVSDLAKRIDDTEAVCAHIIGCATSCSGTAGAFQCP